jgi:hypothetical protein
MRQEVNQPGSKPVYKEPTIDVLGGFAQLTLGGKTSGFGDLLHGHNASTGSGPGS